MRHSHATTESGREFPPGRNLSYSMVKSTSTGRSSKSFFRSWRGSMLGGKAALARAASLKAR